MKYAGIGSRKTPESMRPVINEIARRLDALGATLRSGGAEGADTFFQEGASSERMEIFIPESRGKRAHFDGAIYFDELPTDVQDRAKMMAKRFHPNKRLQHFVLQLHARNSCQIFGRHMEESDAVDFVVCWNPGGLKSGGTSQAMRIAHSYNIPIFNLAEEFGLAKFNIFMRKFDNNNTSTK